MKIVGAYEAKTHLPRLLREVADGETITITKHGVPVARLVPAEDAQTPTVDKLIAELREFRRTHKLSDVTIRELVEGGRRYCWRSSSMQAWRSYGRSQMSLSQPPHSV
jgi:prevent-host-death family protein